MNLWKDARTSSSSSSFSLSSITLLRVRWLLWLFFVVVVVVVVVHVALHVGVFLFLLALLYEHTSLFAFLFRSVALSLSRALPCWWCFFGGGHPCLYWLVCFLGSIHSSTLSINDNGSRVLLATRGLTIGRVRVFCTYFFGFVFWLPYRKRDRPYINAASCL